MNAKLFRIAALIVILLSVLTVADAQITGKSQQGLTVRKARLWTENRNVVPVCWENSGFDREKDIVMEAVHHTWEEFANITFTGWGACPVGGIGGSATAQLVRIRVFPQGSDNAGASGSARVGMVALSSALDRNPGVNLSFNSNGTADKGRVEYVAVHEFGHVLGFIHEQDAIGNVKDAHGVAHCSSAGAEANSTSLTNYDPDSVMNYCNKDGNMKGYLTVKDIEGVRKAYGERRIQSANQNEWRWCQKCYTVFYNGYPSKGTCAKGGGHAAAAGQQQNYFLPYNTRETAHAQANWRFCNKCQGMFWDGYPDKGKCSTGGGHAAAGYSFTLFHDVIASAMTRENFRYCGKCHALFWDGEGAKGTCAAGGGHAAAGYNFVLRSTP